MTTTPAEPIETLDDLLDRVCAKFCGECRTRLSPPGSQCPECGHLPPETRQEAAERLMSEPDLVDQAEAWRMRKEAMATLGAAERLFREADAEEHRSVLRKARDAAEGRLDAASGGLEDAESALEIAVQAEELAAGPFADAYNVHEQAVTAAEEARRLRMGAAAEVEANVRLEKAAGVLARYRDEAHAATVAKNAAEEALRAVEAEIAGRQREADEAQAALERCSPVPLSAATAGLLAAPLLRMSAGSDINKMPLAATDRLMAACTGGRRTRLPQVSMRARWTAPRKTGSASRFRRRPGSSRSSARSATASSRQGSPRRSRTASPPPGPWSLRRRPCRPLPRSAAGRRGCQLGRPLPKSLRLVLGFGHAGWGGPAC